MLCACVAVPLMWVAGGCVHYRMYSAVPSHLPFVRPGGNCTSDDLDLARMDIVSWSNPDKQEYSVPIDPDGSLWALLIGITPRDDTSAVYSLELGSLTVELSEARGSRVLGDPTEYRLKYGSEYRLIVGPISLPKKYHEEFTVTFTLTIKNGRTGKEVVLPGRKVTCDPWEMTEPWWGN